MAKFAGFQYGRFEKYGIYKLAGNGGGEDGEFQPGPHVRYRIRLRSHDGRASEFLTMCEERATIHTNSKVPIRMRANGGQWVRTQGEDIKEQTTNVRIRAISSQGHNSEWVMSNRGILK